MIKNIASNSAHITVTGNYPPNIYNNGMLNVGQLRYNPSNQYMEVYDGNMWQVLSQGVSVGLSYSAEEAIHWAQRKMREEEELKAKMEKYPALKSAYDQFKMLEILVHEEEQSGT
jgi:hypothetical protein